jgi:hypothetical protein
MQLSLAQLWLRRACLLWLVLPCLATGNGRSSRRFLEEQDPAIDYSMLPGVPSEVMAYEKNAAAKSVNDWSSTQVASSAMHAAAAENEEAAAAAALKTKYEGLQLRTATDQAILSSQRATEMMLRAQASARRAQAMVADMPALALRAAARAIDGTVQGAIHRMDAEAVMVAEKQKAIEAKLGEDAAKAAQIAALPWQQAKLRAGQTMISYVSQARDLANAVTQLKLQAPKMSAQANVLQANGDVVQAQQMQIGAHDVLDKAAQLESQAKGFNEIANKINANLGAYDLSAKAAADYAAYTTNPAGSHFQLPPLPPPLKLQLAGPSPGPAPAPGPAPSGAASPAPAR